MSPSQTSLSSFYNNPGISPVDRTMLIYSKNSSFLTSASVIMKVICFPKCPDTSKQFLISSFKSFSEYDFVTTIYFIWCLPISAANLVNDYFPDPPTPTSKAEDLGY